MSVRRPDGAVSGWPVQFSPQICQVVVEVGQAFVEVIKQHIPRVRFLAALVGAAGAVIAMVPLGLVLLASVAFTVGMVRLARHGVLAQELPAVEGLARVDLICFDKTGTLTDGAVEFDAVHELTPGGAWREVLASFAADERADARQTARDAARAAPQAAREHQPLPRFFNATPGLVARSSKKIKTATPADPLSADVAVAPRLPD